MNMYLELSHWIQKPDRKPTVHVLYVFYVTMKCKSALFKVQCIDNKSFLELDQNTS